MRWFEDMQPGETGELGSLGVSAEDIVAFAREFDPQPFHLDVEAARETMAGGLIASGWHSCALLMRLVANGFLADAASQGAPGVDELRWLKPVRPGDRLSGHYEILETRPSASRPAIGLVRFRFRLDNQDGETVLEQVNSIMIGRRPIEGAA
jgi:acyl dehydratase